MHDLPQHEQEVISTDLPRVEEWLRHHPEANADVHVDREAFDSNQGHVTLVVSVRDPAIVNKARDDLVREVRYPDRLRVRRWKPSDAEVDRIQQWIMATQPTPGGVRTGVSAVGVDPDTGLVTVTLDRSDPEFAAALEAATKGLAIVVPEPETPLPPVAIDTPPQPRCYCDSSDNR